MITSKRVSIGRGLVKVIKEIDGTAPYQTNLFNNVKDRMEFWDEITQFPAVNVNVGTETRDYQGGGYVDRYLIVTVRVYVNQEDPKLALEAILSDIELVIEKYGRLEYEDAQENTYTTRDILIQSIETDEGALDPLGVGEMTLLVRY